MSTPKTPKAPSKTPAKKAAEHLVRIGSPTYMLLVEKQLELVRAGKPKPTLGEIVAMFVKK